MIDYTMRALTAAALRPLGRVASDRRRLDTSETGLRILTFHDLDSVAARKFRRLVEWCGDRFVLGAPEDADALIQGAYEPAATDKILITFDDGNASNFPAAEWLADQGIRATFFVVPSLLDRTGTDFHAFHRRLGVIPHPFGVTERGLARSQVREMLAMGHRIAAHNYAHRDLGSLRHVRDLDYEIGRALDEVSELTGSVCVDFAIAFGQLHNLSPKALSYLIQKQLNVYMCFRGLNLAGKTPRFLLRHSVEWHHPENFTRLCIEGGLDRRMESRRAQLAEWVGLLSPRPEPSPVARS